MVARSRRERAKGPWLILFDEITSIPELLSDVFILLQLYQWDLARGMFSSRRQKKLYAADPLFLAIPSRIHPGSARPERSALAENVAALTLYGA